MDGDGWHYCRACRQRHPFEVTAQRPCPNGKVIRRRAPLVAPESSRGGGESGPATRIAVTSSVPPAEKAQRSCDGLEAAAKCAAEPTRAAMPEAAKAGVASGPREPVRGRPLARDRDKTLEATKPWVAEGVSRRTWFRRRKAKGQA